jgi:hypothetical protein
LGRFDSWDAGHLTRRCPKEALQRRHAAAAAADAGRRRLSLIAFYVVFFGALTVAAITLNQEHDLQIREQQVLGVQR